MIALRLDGGMVGRLALSGRSVRLLCPDLHPAAPVDDGTVPGHKPDGGCQGSSPRPNPRPCSFFLAVLIADWSGWIAFPALDRRTAQPITTSAATMRRMHQSVRTPTQQ